MVRLRQRQRCCSRRRSVDEREQWRDIVVSNREGSEVLIWCTESNLMLCETDGCRRTMERLFFWVCKERKCKDCTLVDDTLPYNPKSKWRKATVYRYSWGNSHLIWMVTMGNAATCKACGSDNNLKTTGSNSDVNQHSDYYKAAGCRSEVDYLLVRVGETPWCLLLLMTFLYFLVLTLHGWSVLFHNNVLISAGSVFMCVCVCDISCEGLDPWSHKGACPHSWHAASSFIVLIWQVDTQRCLTDTIIL